MQHYIEVIGVCGLARSGKDTLAKFLIERLASRTERIALADALKMDVVNLGLATEEEVFVTKPPRVRRILQIWGTEHGRAVDDQYWLLRWCAAAFKMCASAGGNPPMPARFVVPDIRYPNEARFILEDCRGWLFWIDAEERLGKPMNHASELSLPKIVKEFSRHARFLRISNNSDEDSFLELANIAATNIWPHDVKRPA